MFNTLINKSKQLSDYKLNIAVFLNGMVILIIELVAVRIIAPYFGSSFFVWTSIIGVILASLSVGYWQGGKLADTEPSESKLSVILLGAAVMILLCALLQNIVLNGFEHLFLDVRWQSLFAALVLFAPANVLLGMVSPYIARLEISQVKESGHKVGNIYAAGTLGSLVGVFGAGYFLIAMAGSTRLLLITALLTIVTSFVVNLHKWWLARVGLLIVVFVLICTNPKPVGSNPKVIADIDSSYTRYLVTDISYKGRQVTALQTDFHNGQSAVEPANPNQLVFDYTKAFDAYQSFNPSPSSALMIGGGGNVYPQHFAQTNSNSHIDVVEIDPQLASISQKYLVPSLAQNVNVISQDGRIFLNNNSKKYDLAFVDAFNNDSVPFHLTTQESVRDLNNSLSDNGVVLVNLIGYTTSEKSKFLQAMYSTYSSVFPDVRLYQVTQATPNQARVNVMLVASKQPDVAITPVNDAVERMLTQQVVFDADPRLVLTDDFAPVEQYFSL